jgi:hypothetical protein
MRLENQKQRITAMNFIAPKRQECKEKRFVISTPSAKLRVNFGRNLSPSHSLGMTSLSPSLGVLCVFARVIVFPFPQTTFQPIIVDTLGCLYAASCGEF